ncbi:hypothetical protein JVW21_20445, partial [Vibrio cholerae O1]|uniref:hypothetical protein n=1 Tax=Vibrio cholerae TaxID=666 RepID=UPI001C0FD55A
SANVSGLIFFVNGNEKSPELLECRRIMRLILSVDHTIIFARQKCDPVKIFPRKMYGISRENEC